MDKFIESKDFERALSYSGTKTRNGGEAKSSHNDQKTGSSGGNRMR